MKVEKTIFNLSNFIIQESVSIIDAAAAIDGNGKQIIFICEGTILLATFTDGDLRRYVLSSGDVRKSVKYAANYNPIKVTLDDKPKIKRMIQENPYLRAIPVVDKENNIISIEFLDNVRIAKRVQLDIPVVIMAGGKGTRLAPYTDVLPKPLIPVGNKTITELIIDKFLDFGCNDFTMIVNYKKELIKAYFNEVSISGKLRFVDENNFNGTGGGLKLISGVVDRTFLMTNCDILVEADYEDILLHHKRNSAIITMICALKRITVPYGTVELNGNGDLVRLIEKPDYPLLTNTGLYVIEPEFLDFIPSDTFIHITDIIQKLIENNKKVSVYPMGEAGWLDIGQIDELNKVKKILE